MCAQVVLHSGDVLFIPPLWLHHVTSLTCSAGINVFSPSVEGTALNAMLSVPLPFEQQWTMEHTITALVSLLAEVVSRFGTTWSWGTAAVRICLTPPLDTVVCWCHSGPCGVHARDIGVAICASTSCGRACTPCRQLQLLEPGPRQQRTDETLVAAA